MPETFGAQVRRLGRLVRKEVTTILRDRRTILTLVLMPVLLYPLLTIAFLQFGLVQTQGKKEEEPSYYLVAITNEDYPYLQPILSRGEKRLKQEDLPADALPLANGVPTLKREERAINDPMEELRAHRAHAALRLRRGTDGKPLMQPGRGLECDIFYLHGSARGKDAAQHVVRIFEASHRVQLNAMLLRSNAPVAVLPQQPAIGAIPDPVISEDLSIQAIIPLVLILMTITGAVYPAIDLTAGERERGTLEILVAAPVPRLGLLFAKYVSVVCVAVLTAIVNLTMMTVSLQVTGLGAILFGMRGFTPAIIIEIFFLLLLFTLFFSAVLLAVTSFARSFKEAQAYLVPLMLVSLSPGLAGLIPGIELQGGMLIVPLLNIVLLARDVMLGSASLAAATVVVLSTLIYALAAIALAARLFGAEAVLYSEQGGWSDLFRRPSRPQPTVSVAGALLCIAVLFSAQFIGVHLLLRWQPTQLDHLLLLQIVISLLLIGGLPALFAWMGRVQWRSGFQLERQAVWSWPAAFLLGFGLTAAVNLLNVLLSEAGLTSLPGGMEKRAEEFAARLHTASLVLVLLAFAVVPAVVEEWCFRGLLFSALLRALGPRGAILVSALLFGVFHLTDRGIPLIERSITSGVMGLVLGWVCWRTGSLVPGIILHATFNAANVLVAYYHQQLIDAGWLQSGAKLFPKTWLIASAVACIAALGWLLWFGKARNGEPAA